MPQSQISAREASRPRGVMLVSTACILAAVTFCAGLFAGLTLSSVQQVQQPAVSVAASPEAAQNGSSGHSQEWLTHVEQARASVEKNPNDADAWTHLGNLYFDGQHSEEAVEAYERSLTLSPGNPDVLTDLGTMYRSLGKADEALARFDAAIAARSDHRNARFNRGLTLALDLGRPAEGLAAWKELLALHPDVTMGDGRPLKESFAPLATDAATLLEQQNKNDEALAAYDLALNEQPDFAPAVERKAALLERLGRADEAASLLSRLKAPSATAASQAETGQSATAAGN